MFFACKKISQCSVSCTQTLSWRLFCLLCRRCRLAKLRINNMYRVSSEKSVTHLYDTNGFLPVSRLMQHSDGKVPRRANTAGIPPSVNGPSVLCQSWV